MTLTPQLRQEIAAVASQYNIPTNYFMALIQAESGFNMGSTSPVGAIGYTQLMPGTARGLGVNPHDPHQNLVGGAKYLAQQLKAFNGNIQFALAAYNAGPGAVSKYGGIPPYSETQNYVRNVMKYAQQYGGSIPSSLDFTSSAPPQVAVPQVEQATSPLSPTLPSGPKFGVAGTSVRNPTLTIRPLSVQRVQAGQSSGFGVDPGASSVGYPLGVRGKQIGSPHSGTHNLGNWQSDNAVDIAVPIGTPVYAVSDGIIGSRIGSLGKGGRFAGLRVTLQGGNDSYYYAHLSKLRVKAGQRVRAGQLIGYSGSANGVAHLHFGVMNGNVEAMLGY